MRPIKLLRAGSRWHRWPQTAATAAIALLLAGCAEKRAHAYPWATALAVRPIKPVPAPGYQPADIDDAAPDLRPNIPQPAKLAVVKQPIRPRTTVPQATDPNVPTKPEAFSLVPELSEKEITAAQQQMNDSVSVAQKNLATAKGHRLNPTQSDLSSKVNSFIEESKGAAREGDWNRARNLAKKAQVLSEELADSL